MDTAAVAVAREQQGVASVLHQAVYTVAAVVGVFLLLLVVVAAVEVDSFLRSALLVGILDEA